MITVVFFGIILMLCLFLSSFSMPGDEYNFVSIVFITLSTFVLIYYIFTSKYDKKVKLILLLAFLIRFIFMLIDLYVFRLPHAATDDDGFYSESVDIFNGVLSIKDSVYGSYYTKLLYILYLFIGSNRASAQFTSVILSMISLFYLIKICNKLNFSDKKRNLCLILMSFMPNLIFLNSILRRDTLITLLLLMSIDKIVDWYKTGKLKYAIWAFIFAFLATLIHAALLFVLLIYFLFVFLYDRENDKNILQEKKFIKLIIVVISLLVFVLFFMTNFSNKFSKFTSYDVLYESVSVTKGNSAYLENININNMYQLILFTPIKWAYFLFSPMPWDARGIVDICTFLLDSCIYLYFTIIFIKNKKMKISKLFFWIFIVLSIVFGLGTFNAGTAARHRYNILPFLLIGSCYILDNKKTKIEKGA